MSKQLTKKTKNDVKQAAEGSQISDLMDQMLQAARYLKENDLVPKGRSQPSEPQLVALISAGQSLGMDPITAVNSIDLIQGSMSIKSRIIPGLLSRAGIAIELVKDYEPVMGDPIPMKGDDGKVVIDDDGVIKYYKDPDGNYIRKEIDRVTTLRFIRDYGGSVGVIKNDISFYWSDAVNAGWISKDNWMKLPRFMMYARCLARGARAFASDAVNGMYDQYETAEFSNVNFTVNESGELVLGNHNSDSQQQNPIPNAGLDSSSN